MADQSEEQEHLDFGEQSSSDGQESSDFEQQIKEEHQKVDYRVADWTIEVLMSKLKNGTVFIPKYQREFVWNESRRTSFIESLLIGLPIPFIFLAPDPESGNLEIIDGVQRLSTIRDFMDNRLRLRKLLLLNLASGERFSDLTSFRQRAIENITLRAVVLGATTSPATRLELFRRINTGSKIAGPAEIRRAIFQGPFMALVEELAVSDGMVRLSPLSEAAVNERKREELVTRFFAYGDGIVDYKDDPLQFADRYAERMTKEFADNPDLVGIYRDRFTRMISAVDALVDSGFSKSRTRTGQATQNGRFESISIGFDRALRELGDQLTTDSALVSEALHTDEFAAVVRSDGANAKAKLIRRMNYVYEKLIELSQ